MLLARHRAALLGAAALLALVAAALAAPSSARAAVEVGVYQDRPVRGVPALGRRAGPRATRVISVYVTAGRRIPPRVVALARRRGARLMVTWMPDAGRPGPRQPRHRLKRVVRGGRDRSLARMVRQMRGLVPSPILRPMPEPNTRWYAWSGTVNGNSPDDYVAAWRRVHRVAKRASGGWVKGMWAPYHRNIPARTANAPAAYFPGDEYVDLVGTSGYNFGRQRGLRWISPSGLFASSYRTITGLSARPFWIAETATTARGGSKAGWMRALAALPARLPRLNGIVWYDVRDGKGDFRVRQSRATLRAFLRRAGAR